MATIKPTDLFVGYTADNTSITIPLSALSGLSASEANATTGDGRELCRILMDVIFTKYNALADKPTKMTVTKSNPTGISTDQIRQSYAASFDISYASSGVSMVSEG